MATSQTKAVTRTPWHTGSTVLLLLISLGTITYTLIVTRQLADSIENLKKEMTGDGEKLHRMYNKRITDLERNCAQGRTNILHADENVKIQRLLKKRGIRSISDNTYIWKMIEGLTTKSNNTVVLPILLGRGLRFSGTKGPPGPRGKPGPIGPKGAKGDQGMIGSKGVKGDLGGFGQKGAKGDVGSKGAKGDSIALPRIVVAPINQTVLENNVATFICEAVGNPIPSVKFIRNNKTMDERYKRIGEGMLQIVNVTTKDEGEIICIAKSVLGEDKRKVKLSLLVKANADIPEEITEGEEGYDITIKCKVKGRPFPIVRWHRLAANLPSNVEHNKISNTLLIKKARRGDGGKYVCNAENYLRNSTDKIDVQVRKRLSFLFKTPDIVNSVESENVSIYCYYESGAQPIKVLWFKDDKALPNKAALSKKNQVLSIPKINKNDTGSYKCIVQSKFSILQKVTKVVVLPKTCNDIRLLGTRKSGNYVIYPLDARPVSAYCDMVSRSNKGVTVISHDNEARTIVTGLEGEGSYKRRIRYDIPIEMVKAIIGASDSCEQYIKYECYDSVIYSGNTPFAWWVSSSGRKMSNWGGVDHTKKGCSCSLTGTCATNKKCNCDANDGVWREDSGYLKEKEYLPISEVRFGDTGDSSEKGYHTIGKLKCY